MRAFFDSNIFVYAFTPGDGRRDVAWRLIEQHGANGSLVLSTQVLMETYNVLSALELSAQHKLSTWDALIVQAALEGGCDTLYSEDMQAGRRFGNLDIVNPFELKAHEPAPARKPAVKAPRPAAPRGRAARA